MTRLLRMRTYVAVLGALAVGAVAAYVIISSFGHLDGGEGQRDALESNAGKRGPAMIGASRNDSDAAAPSDVNCSRIDDIGEKLLDARRRREFARIRTRSGGNLPVSAVEVAADRAGLDPDIRFGRVFLDGPADRPLYPLPVLSAQPLSWLKQEALRKQIDSGALDTVFKDLPLAHQSATVTDYQDAAARYPTVTVLGAVIRGHGAVSDQWLDDVPDDWPVRVHDLAVAIEENVSATAFERLLDRKGGAAAEWPDDFTGRDVNLAQLAAFHRRPELLRMLIARDVDPVAGSPPLLDDIARLPERSQDEADVVDMLVAAGVTVRRPGMLGVLVALYPGQPGLALDPGAKAAMASAEVAELARRLGEAKDRWDVERDELEFWRARCGDGAASTGRRAIASAAPSDESGLTAKRQHDLARRLAHEQEVQEAAAASLVGAGPPRQRDDHQRDLVTRAYESAVNGQWDEAVAIANGLHPPFSDFVNRDLLSHALEVGASMDSFEALLDLNDGILPDDAILDLCSRGWEGSADLAEALLVDGLDVHHVDRIGRNAFSSIAESTSFKFGLQASSSKELATFLQRKG